MLSTRALAARAHLAAAYQSVLSLHFHKKTFTGYTRNKMGPQALSPAYSLEEAEPWLEDVRGSREHRSDRGWTEEAHTAPGRPGCARAALPRPRHALPREDRSAALKNGDVPPREEPQVPSVEVPPRSHKAHPRQPCREDAGRRDLAHRPRHATPFAGAPI